MKAVLVKAEKAKAEMGDLAELKEALQELDRDPRLVESVREFVNFHTGKTVKKSH